MTYSLKISSGDLAMDGSSLALVVGKDKLAQDLDLWMRERYGDDAMHPTYGSVLDSYIGGIIGVSTQMDVTAEVNRVLSNYQALQLQRYHDDSTRFDVGELLDSIISIDTVISYDSVNVAVVYQTLSGNVATLTTGATVQ